MTLFNNNTSRVLEYKNAEYNEKYEFEFLFSFPNKQT